MLHALVNGFIVRRSRLRSSRRKRRYFRWYPTRRGGHIGFRYWGAGHRGTREGKSRQRCQAGSGPVTQDFIAPSLIRLVTNSFPRSFHYGLQTIRGNLHTDAQQHERDEAQNSLHRRWRHLLRDSRSVRVAQPKRDSHCDNCRGDAEMG
jgi:hypothetical protein